MIIYEWDELKYLSNLEKHKVDFLEAKFIYENPEKVSLSVIKNDEVRYMDIAPLNNRLMVLIYVMRGDVVRVISFRKAHNPKEIDLYHKLQGEL